MREKIVLKPIEQIKEICLNLNLISVYDIDSYSMTELYYKVAQKINEIITEMTRFETSLTDSLIEQNKKLENIIDTGVTNDVINKIDEMVTDGTLETIINNDLFNKLNSKIENITDSITTFNIANYNHVSGDNITQTIKEIMSVAKNGDVIFIPTGEYIINETIELLPNMVLKGKSTRESILKAENCNCISINGESILKPNTKGHKQGINIYDISLYCEDQDFHIIQASACSHITFNNVYLFGSNRSAVDGVEFFDVRWINCWFYWCGDYEGNYPVLNFRNSHGYEYNNNHFFYGCMFESNRGQILKIDAEYNTEFKFVSCKFENTESSVIQFKLRNCGGIMFTDCMFSAQGRNKINYETIFSLENCWGVSINGTLYKWDDLNGNRQNYAIPKSLMNITNCRSYKIDLVLYNNIVRLQNDNASYIQVWNGAKDGSYINLIKHNTDNRKIVDTPQTLNNNYNVDINHDDEPFIGISSKGTSWQFGRLVEHEDSTKCRLICYDKEGGEHQVIDFEKSKFNINSDMFIKKGLYIGRYANETPWGWGGCIYYDTINNQYKFYVDNEGWKTLNLV